MKWRIVQYSDTIFEIQSRFPYWPFWFHEDNKDTLHHAKVRMDELIRANFSYPRVIEEVQEEVAYVALRLQGK